MTNKEDPAVRAHRWAKELKALYVPNVRSNSKQNKVFHKEVSKIMQQLVDEKEVDVAIQTMTTLLVAYCISFNIDSVIKEFDQLHSMIGPAVNSRSIAGEKFLPYPDVVVLDK